MSSLTEEEKLIEMVSNFIESEQAESSPTSKSHHHKHKPTCLALQEILGETTDTEVKILQLVLKHVENEEFPSARDLKKLVVKKLKLDGFEASLCRTFWDFTFNGSEVFHFRCDYEYIEVMMGEKKKNSVITPTRLIVDMDFRTQFELAKPTRAYEELTQTLPCVFVGTEAKLAKVISLLCSAAKESLKERGFHVPPWRKASYMQSKWLSKNCERVSLGLAEI